MIRRLTSAERELWEQLRRSVRPLRPEPTPPSKPTPEDAEAEITAARPQTAAQSLGSPPAVASAAPALAGLEPKTRRRLARGLTEVDARIDLHGMRQDRAFTALFSFLRHAQLRGSKLVLVITGKGREGHDSRGVLRHVVPAWLSRPDFRDLVVGFEEAGRRHGGAGALYVRLRRRKEGRYTPEAD
jgi:DNA-nicking Smr family endonuclease